MKKVIVTTSWDDGHVLDLKLSELLKKYSIKGTFYVAPQNRDFEKSQLLSDLQLQSLSQDFEIGAHTMTHPRLGHISLAEANKEIKGSKEYLEELLQKPVESFCYPGGSYNFMNAQQVKKCGFLLARTVKRFSSSNNNNPYEIPTSLQAYNHRSDLWQIVRFANFNPIKFVKYYNNWDLLVMAMFDRVKDEGGVFHLWGHSWEIDKKHFWKKLESVFEYIGNQPDVDYVTNRELL
ncbi:MAG: polysaccharide deacetylase family protein [Candidatus Paceibacterota bacterium]